MDIRLSIVAKMGKRKEKKKENHQFHIVLT